ncbi:DUF934 domain-containing protein [Solimonas terrae]|uniref:DUF934 domain-containing protein n=1 Tax=Solimonas terrae TaxID=1396819 RepID=A0A6M2BLL5_9GAMM|nr:DUF934 domain-containing protein [Solimonas terrae]NGY03602.1 DUF934 domain-containing protein [Solimonas terrae]
MSALLRGHQIATDDYVALADDESGSEGSRVIVSLARWLEQGEALAGRFDQVGVRLPNTVELSTIWAGLASRPLIELDFPAFADGRAYSQARLLRDRYGFSGEIRASGMAVVRDQMQSMARAGIDSFVLRADQDANSCLAALRDFNLAYQPAADRLPIVSALRRSAGP